ncbi:MAG: tryptophan--tRNA ligase [SAR202 cluster bacterium]|nr:tryptophan--tRNA ligase [SAR202 cluster bacterium]
MNKKRVFSGIQPTGEPHLGNFIGAIGNWVADQGEYENIFCVVDQHAITVDYDPVGLRENTRMMVAILLSAGIDPERSIMFVQSHIPEHTELTWLLTCVTPMGWLQRMTQFKDKGGGKSEVVGTGLFTYPVLMASDILLYRTDAVPVGEDQKQHVELARDIANRFNNEYGNVFTIPEPLIRPIGARVMGLDDPTKKMSKSEKGQYHSIGLLDDEKKIRKKLGRAITDSDRQIVFDPKRPGVFNLLTIFRALSGKSEKEIESHFEGKGYGDLKGDLADLVIASLGPLQKRYTEITEDRSYVDGVLRDSVEKIRPIVVHTMKQVRKAMGFL